MRKKDLFIGLVIGFLIGVFAIPFTKNIGVFDKFPSPYLILLVGMPILVAFGLGIAQVASRILPVIWQVFKFGAVGVLNTVIDFGVFNVLIFATGFDKGLPVALITAGSFMVAVTNSFFWNKFWVFESGGGSKGVQFLEFIVISSVGALVSATIVGTVTAYISPLGNLTSEQWANSAKALAVVFSFVWNFLGYKFIVFKRQAL